MQRNNEKRCLVETLTEEVLPLVKPEEMRYYFLFGRIKNERCKGTDSRR